MPSANRHFFERRLLTRSQAERVSAALDGRLEWSSLDVMERGAFEVARREQLVAVERLTVPRRTEDFMMLYHKRHAVLMDRLTGPLCRVPVAAPRLLAICFTLMREEDGEVIATREHLVKRLGISERGLTLALKELVDAGALIRSREPEAGKRGRGYTRYFVNPKLATYLTDPYRSAAQAAAPEVGRVNAPALALVGGSSLPTERRSRAPVVDGIVL